MPDTTYCRDCGAPTPSSARSCPECGILNPVKQWVAMPDGAHATHREQTHAAPPAPFSPAAPAPTAYPPSNAFAPPPTSYAPPPAPAPPSPPQATYGAPPPAPVSPNAGAPPYGPPVTETPSHGPVGPPPQPYARTSAGMERPGAPSPYTHETPAPSPQQTYAAEAPGTMYGEPVSPPGGGTMYGGPVPAQGGTMYGGPPGDGTMYGGQQPAMYSGQAPPYPGVAAAANAKPDKGQGWAGDNLGSWGVFLVTFALLKTFVIGGFIGGAIAAVIAAVVGAALPVRDDGRKLPYPLSMAMVIVGAIGSFWWIFYFWFLMRLLG